MREGIGRHACITLVHELATRYHRLTAGCANRSGLQTVSISTPELSYISLWLKSTF